MKIINVCGARPNFIKIAPLAGALANYADIHTLIVHTGQHYDDNMSRLFFDELGIPKPDINLDVGSGSHAQQTAAIMARFEPLVLREKPDAVLVVGDVNSTLACALVACKMGIATIHVEAGLRSFDRSMPEETNRMLTDAVSDLLMVSEPSGLENLRREGIDSSRVHFVGNISNVLKLMESSFVFLAPIPEEEGFCLVALEAKSSGLPVVAFRRGAVPELVEHEETGFLCRGLDRESLIEGIDYFLSDAEARDRASEASRRAYMDPANDSSHHVFARAWQVLFTR